MWRVIVGGILGGIMMGPWGVVVGTIVGLLWLGKATEAEEEREFRQWLNGERERNSRSEGEVRCPHCGAVFKTPVPLLPYLTCPNCKRLFFPTPDRDKGVNFGIGLLAKIAKADGVVSPEEAQAIGEIFREVFQLDPEEFQHAKELFKEFKDSPFTIYQVADLFYSAVPMERDFREGVYMLMFRIATADGGLEPVEREILQRILDHLHLPPELYQEGYRIFVEGGGGPTLHQIPLSEAYRLLGVEEGADWEQVKRGYRQRMKELHPDRYQNLPESARRALEEEAKRVNEAYQLLKERLGQ